MFDLIDDTAALHAQWELEYQEWLGSEAWVEVVNQWLCELANEMLNEEA